MRPTNRPKLERRTQRTRPRPQVHYTSRSRDDASGRRTFHMPEDKLDLVPRWKLVIGVCAFVAALFAFGYLFGWSIGHFVKGWW